jgi:ATP-dependent DNA helicase RecG
MTLIELRQALSQLEWRDIEFKKAQRGVPHEAYSTVCAFANTAGGHLVFGVGEVAGGFEIVGVLDPDKVQGDFLSALRGGGKLSCNISVEESRLEADGKVVLAFYIPEARREHKPVHLDRELHKSFIRRGAGDERCNAEEIARFIRDAGPRTYDKEILPELDPETCFDDEMLTWYRSEFDRRFTTHETTGQSLQAFLEFFALLRSTENGLRPTRAAILVFGTSAALNHVLCRPVVDVRRLLSPVADTLPEERWDDRVLMEENLLRCWRRGVQYFTERVADNPFGLDAQTLQGGEARPDYLVFREAFINLLTHQDFGDQSRKAVVIFHSDQIQLWNPGPSHTSGESLYETGDKWVRNPLIRSMLQRIDIGEQAGSGIRTICTKQASMGRLPPTIENNQHQQSFSVTLSKRRMESQRQHWATQHLGVTLTDAEAAIFLQALRQGSIGPMEAAALAGLSPAATGALLKRLLHQQLLEIHPAVQGRSFRPKPIFAERAAELIAPFVEGAPVPPAVIVTPPALSNLTTPQVQPAPSLVTAGTAPAASTLSDQQESILRFCDVARSVPALLEHMGMKNRTYFKKKHLDPLIARGFLRPTHPKNPRHPDQGYLTTPQGRALIAPA